ncbi:MAG: helix-turn-helix transcriptional regulator [Ruminococcus sp.]
MNFSINKSFRLLNIYERLNRGEELHKDKLADDFAVSLKTVQRDIDELRAYLEQTHFSESDTAIKYDKAKNCYYLIRPEREWMTNEEALALCKILLESRAFCKDELSGLIDKLIAQVSPYDRSIIKSIIKNELFNYVPLRHGKKLLNQIWTLSQYITKQEIISFKYHRQDGKQSVKIVKPLSIMFSEFYFYLIAFMADESKNYPIIFRIDRITEIKNTGEHFTIDYRNKFKDGEFRKRVQFMYAGELKTVKFEYSGVLEAILDRLPTAKILKEENGVYTISAETYGDGIYMWLKSQGDMVRIL